MKKITSEELQNLKKLTETEDKINLEIVARMMASLELIPPELLICMETYNDYKKAKLEVLENGDLEVSVNIGCVCSYKQTGVIDHLYKIKNLVRFEYFCDKIRIPESFSQLTQMRELNMGWSPNKGNEDYLFSIFSNYKNLEVLKMYKNRLDYLPESIGEFKKMKSLGLSGNDIEVLPDSILELEDLRVLGLVESQFSEVPQHIFWFKNLRALYLQENKFQFLPEEILKLEKLEVLDISKCKMEHFPEVVFELPALKVLKIKETNFPEAELERAKEQLGEVIKDKYYHDPEEEKMFLS